MLPKLEREIAQNNVFPLLLFNLSTAAFWVRSMLKHFTSSNGTCFKNLEPPIKNCHKWKNAFNFTFRD